MYLYKVGLLCLGLFSLKKSAFISTKQNQLSQHIRSRYFLLYNLIQMKKFLNLKQSIVDSKNQPTLIQTYLDSIRSSCYKLSVPAYSIAIESPSAQATQKIPLPLRPNYDQSTTITHKPNNLTEHNIDEIFNSLSSSCRNSHRGISEQEIIDKILTQLSHLEKNEEFKQPVSLIRKIISTMNSFTKIHTHENTATPSKFLKTKLDDSSLKSCPFDDELSMDWLGHKNDKNGGKPVSHLKIKSILKKSASKGTRAYRTQYFQGNACMDMKSNLQQSCEQYETSQFLNSGEGESTLRQGSESERYCVIKYKSLQPGESAEGDIIDLSDWSEGDDRKEMREEDSDSQNTMQSQDLNQWNEDLYRISEQPEQEEAESAKKQSKDESIEFKKIIYMLDSSTHKKVSPKQNIKISNVSMNSCTRKLETSDNNKQNVISSSRLTCKSSKMCQQKQDKSKTIKDIVSMLNSKYNKNIKI